MLTLDECLIFLESVELTFGVFQQSEGLGLVVEVALAEHSVVDENFDVIPLLLKLLSIVLEDGSEAVAHLLGDVSGNLLHIRVALQIATAYVQRNVWRINHTMQQGHEVGHDAFHVVGHEHLVAVEVNLVLLNVQITLHFREIKDTREVKRIIYVQVNPEQWFIAHGVEFLVELLVVLIFQLRWFASPEWGSVVDDIIFIGLHALLLLVVPFGLLAECHRHREELAILVQ